MKKCNLFMQKPIVYKQIDFFQLLRLGDKFSKLKYDPYSQPIPVM